MTLNILLRAVSLTKITLCVDILNVALFGALCNQSYLREVEILLPSSTSQRGLHVREVLNRDYALSSSSSSSSSSNLVLSVLVFILLCSGFEVIVWSVDISMRGVRASISDCWQAHDERRLQQGSK